jgi:hypothetical protein
MTTRLSKEISRRLTCQNRLDRLRNLLVLGVVVETRRLFGADRAPEARPSPPQAASNWRDRGTSRSTAGERGDGSLLVIVGSPIGSVRAPEYWQSMRWLKLDEPFRGPTRCVQTAETPRPYGIEPPRPRVEAVRVVDMSESNSWARPLLRHPLGVSRPRASQVRAQSPDAR